MFKFSKEAVIGQINMRVKALAFEKSRKLIQVDCLAEEIMHLNQIADGIEKMPEDEKHD